MQGFRLTVWAVLGILFLMPNSIWAGQAAQKQQTAETAPPDSDANVTLQCPAKDYGTPVNLEGEVSLPGDGTDVVNYTVEVPPKSQYNTGLWSFKASVKACTGVQTNATRFTLPGGRTEIGCSSGTKQLFDMTMNPNSNRTGKITVSAARGPGSNTPVYTKYTLTFFCGIYRAN